MEVLKFDLTKKEGKFKSLNATNGGPWGKRKGGRTSRSNFKEYKEARIPYSRNHDSAYVALYGGPYCHDITQIFPNFDADVNAPSSYDFACTDESILATLDVGTETFFRLGQSIEHHIKKHGTLPPKDFHKWAEICEHIILHYNYGWADGYELNIKYWEIWNEPDLDSDDSQNKRTWGGTKAEFFDMYEIAAKHLKSRFPELMIGGPAIANRVDWASDFISEMSKRNVPFDFFSWHIYCEEPQKIVNRANIIKNLLLANGYENTETILNEWNYVKDWSEKFKYSIMMIHDLKGASFMMACITTGQKCDAIDMMMYYDTRPSVWCGVFDFYTFEPLKGYYPLMWYGKFYDMEAEIRCESEPENIYTLCGVDKDGKAMCVVTNYSDNDNAPAKDIKIDFGREGKYEIYMVDREKDGELVETTNNLEFTLEPCTFMLIKEI